MNFRFVLTYCFFFFAAVGCGVKSAPAVPQDAPIPSYSAQFMQTAAPATEADTDTTKKDVP